MKAHILFVIRVLLGLTCFISGLSKFTDLHAFAATIKDFGLVPDSIGSVLAVIIPSLECVSGLMLLLGLLIRDVLMLGIALLIFNEEDYKFSRNNLVIGKRS